MAILKLLVVWNHGKNAVSFNQWNTLVYFKKFLEYNSKVTKTFIQHNNAKRSRIAKLGYGIIDPPGIAGAMNVLLRIPFLN